MLSNACVCEQAQRQECADRLQDMVFKQTRERSSAHSRSCYTGACILGPAPSPQNMASPTSCCQLSFLKAYRTGTELAPYWHPYCVNPACIATTMLTLAQICDNDSLPVSSDFSSAPLVFQFSSRQSGSLQWPSLATEMKTSWCCICKFLMPSWDCLIPSVFISLSLQSPPSHDNKDVSEWSENVSTPFWAYPW